MKNIKAIHLSIEQSKRLNLIDALLSKDYYKLFCNLQIMIEIHNKAWSNEGKQRFTGKYKNRCMKINQFESLII